MAWLQASVTHVKSAAWPQLLLRHFLYRADHLDAGVQFDDALPERLLEDYQYNVAEKQVLTDYAIDHRIMADHEAEQTPRFGPDRFL